MRQFFSVVVIAGLSVLLTEMTFAIMMRYPSAVPDGLLAILTQYYYDEEQPYIQYIPECAQYDPTLTYTLRPGTCRFRGREFDTTVRVNSLGVRDDQHSTIAPHVLVLGDSIAMGWGVEAEQTFANLIEQRTNLKVLNMAVSSYGTVRELEIARRADLSGLKYIILQYSDNDADENVTYVDSGNQLPISSAETYRSIQQQHLARTKYYLGKYTVWIIKRLFISANELFAKAPVKRDDAFYFFKVLFALYPSLDSPNLESAQLIVLGSTWPRTVAGMTVEKLDKPGSLDEIWLLGWPVGRKHYYPIDRHLTPDGHRSWADSLVRLIQGCMHTKMRDGVKFDENVECGFTVYRIR